LNLAAGFTAAGFSFYFFLKGMDNLPTIFAPLFLFFICITDTISSKIPNIVICSFIIAGVGMNLFTAGSHGLFFSVGGLLTGLATLLIPYLMGGVGAGDVKALAALGAIIGPINIFQVFLYAALAGGLLSMLYYLFDRNLLAKLNAWRIMLFSFMATKDRHFLKPVSVNEKIKFPYAAAIAFGYCAFLNWGTFF